MRLPVESRERLTEALVPLISLPRITGDAEVTGQSGRGTIRELQVGRLETKCRVEIESISVAVLKSRTPDRIMRPLENSCEGEAAFRSFRRLGRRT
jgi:hypothetical protein